jgi:hypothetical protein
MRADYQVLSRVVDAEFSVDGLLRDYRSGPFSGVFLRVDRGFTLSDAEFLLDLEGLKYVELDGIVLDDSATFRLQEVNELLLLTRCAVRVPKLGNSEIRRLGVDGRPGLDEVAKAPNLSELLLWEWGGVNFKFLSSAVRLRRLCVEGERQVSSLEGLQFCKELQSVELSEMRVPSLAPLSGLGSLRRLRILGDQRIPECGVLDFRDISQLGNLQELRITYGGVVRSLAPLMGLARLRDIRLRGTSILDGGAVHLESLSRRATVVGPND